MCASYRLSVSKSETKINLSGITEFERICQDPKDGELCLCRMKSEEILMEVQSDTDVQIVRVTWVQGRKTNRTIQQLVPSEVSLRIAGDIKFCRVKLMIRGFGVFNTSAYSQTLNRQGSVFLK